MVKEKEKIEIARNMLNNAININMSPETIQKISEELDKYIIDYYRNEKTWNRGRQTVTKLINL